MSANKNKDLTEYNNTYYQKNKISLKEKYQENKEKLALKYQENKEKLALKYQENKKKLLNYQAEYNLINREKIQIYQHSYYYNHTYQPTIRLNKEDTYYAINKDKIKLKNCNITCSCGKTLLKNSIPRHLLTKFHMNYLKKN